MNTSLRSISNHNQKQECGKDHYERSYLDYLWLASLLSLLERVTLHVNQVVHAGRVALAEYFGNKRYLIGCGFGMVGILQLFAYLLFNEASRDRSWYYLNFYYLLETIRWCVALSLSAIAILFHTPIKEKTTWVMGTLVFAGGLVGVVHYSIASSNEMYHSFPQWYVVLMGLALAIGFVIAVPYLCYRKYHLKDGNYARIIGIIEMDIPWEKKEQMLKTLAQEFRDFNARI
jgi:hypothetical protein